MLLLGIDGGGTKTEAVLCDEQGAVLGVCVSGPANPNGQDRERAAGTIRKCVDTLLEGCNDRDLMVFAGIAGCISRDNAEAMRSVLISACKCPVCVTSDAVSALSAGVGAGEDGIIAICGTGSSCFSRKKGLLMKTGGWGYLFGDAGSAYAFGKAALQEVMRAEDGYTADDILTDIVNVKLGRKIGDALPAIYAGGRTEIASYSICVSEALQAGSFRAKKLVMENAASVAKTIIKSAEKASIEDASVVIAGSIWERMPLFFETVKASCPDMRFIVPENRPVYGSVAEAALAAGMKTGDSFSECFSRTYALCPQRTV